MRDLIDRRAAIKAVGYYCLQSGDKLLFADKPLKELPSAQGDAEFISWLLDEVWDDELWELNYRVFPELLCRRLVKAGWLKEEGGQYVRFDWQTGGD